MTAVLALGMSMLGGSAGASHALAAEPSAFDAGTVATLQAALDTARRERPIPGISAAIQLGDGTRWEGVAGVGERGPGGWAVDPSTPFVVASITKTFVAAAVLQLADEGVLSIDDPLGRWLPDHPRGDIVTLRHLLGHTSGEANYFGHPDYEALVFGRPTHRWTTDEILSLVGAPRFTPGSEWQYSNTNYVLLGLVLEAATGKGVGQVIRERFLDPLGLRETWFQGEEEVPVEPSQAYLRRDGRWISLDDGTRFRPHTSAATVAWAAGAMISSARDLATWARALYGGQVLSAASLAEMVTFGEDDYGLGAKTYLMGGRTAWGHGGSLRGAEATMRYLPELDAAVVVLWNRGGVESSELARELAGIALAARYPDTTAPVIDGTSFSLREGELLEGRTVPAELRWSALETESGVARYDVRMSVDGGPWQVLPTTPASAFMGEVPRALELDLQAGRRYTFSIMATDYEGNVGGWRDTVTTRARILQEKHASIALDAGWRRVERKWASGGRTARTRQAALSARISGGWLALAWVSARSPGGGQAEVSLDAQEPRTVDLGASALEPRRLVFSQSFADATTREVVIRTMAGPDPGVVQLDAMVVLVPEATQLPSAP